MSSQLLEILNPSTIHQLSGLSTSIPGWLSSSLSSSAFEQPHRCVRETQHCQFFSNLQWDWGGWKDSPVSVLNFLKALHHLCPLIEATKICSPAIWETKRALSIILQYTLGAFRNRVCVCVCVYTCFLLWLQGKVHSSGKYFLRNYIALIPWRPRRGGNIKCQKKRMSSVQQAPGRVFRDKIG